MLSRFTLQGDRWWSVKRIFYLRFIVLLPCSSIISLLHDRTMLVEGGPYKGESGVLFILLKIDSEISVRVFKSPFWPYGPGPHPKPSPHLRQLTLRFICFSDCRRSYAGE